MPVSPEQRKILLERLEMARKAKAEKSEMPKLVNLFEELVKDAKELVETYAPDEKKDTFNKKLGHLESDGKEAVQNKDKRKINQVIELLEGPVVNLPKRPGEPDITFADINAISAELGWHPEVSLEEGIRMLKECISDWKDAPIWDAESIDAATKSWFKYLKA